MWGVVHQIAYHHNVPALTQLLQVHPRVDLKLPTKDGLTFLQVAQDQDDCSGTKSNFVEFLQAKIETQTHHELVNKVIKIKCVKNNLYFNHDTFLIPLPIKMKYAGN